MPNGFRSFLDGVLIAAVVGGVIYLTLAHLAGWW
jgi:hypothetical protein